MIKILYLIGFIWVAWLFIDGLFSGTVWVKGGAKDRFTRSLDMQSFAHKVSRHDSPAIYWVMILLYLIFLGLMVYLGFFKQV